MKPPRDRPIQYTLPGFVTECLECSWPIQDSAVWDEKTNTFFCRQKCADDYLGKLKTQKAPANKKRVSVEKTPARRQSLPDQDTPDLFSQLTDTAE